MPDNPPIIQALLFCTSQPSPASVPEELQSYQPLSQTQAQDALKTLMEQYTSNTFFIITCNKIQKIIEPIQSRCITIEFKKPNKNHIEIYLMKICKQEDLPFDTVGLNKLIDINYPSIRDMVTILQDLKIQSKSVSIKNVTCLDEEYIPLWKLIEGMKFTEVKKKIIEDSIDVEEFNNWIFDYCMKGNVELKKELKIYQSLAKNEKAFKQGADLKIVFIAELVNIMMVMKN